MLASISQTVMDPDGMALTKSEYGQMFFFLLSGVLVVPSIFPRLCRRFEMEKMYRFAALMNIAYLAIIYLTITTHVVGSAAYIVLAISSAMGGAANSLTISNLQFVASAVFPEKTKITTIFIHALVSIGASAGPGYVALTSGMFSLSSNLLCFTLISILPVALLSFLSHRLDAKGHQHQEHDEKSSLGWIATLFLLLCMGYGFVEGFSGNWAVTYVEIEKGQPRASAQSCLSLIWFFITVGRLGVMLLMKKIPSSWLHSFSPLVMLGGLATCFLGNTLTELLIGFSILGLGLSYFFPMTVGMSLERFPKLHSKLASYSSGAVMIGFAMGSVGVGVISDHMGIALGQFFVVSMILASVLFVVTLSVHRPVDA
ncbi:MAG: hypothetical protein R3A11_10140 [Bdellovibrionota bacterium]